MKIVLATGGFDPLHSGHINYLKEAASYGPLIVGLNSDEWLRLKKGKEFMPWYERHSVISNLSFVYEVISFDDRDPSLGAYNCIMDLLNQGYEVIFVNGGDRNSKNIPENKIKHKNLTFIYGVGGSFKKNSSSWILDKYKNNKVERPWGYYRVLHTYQNSTKVKELIIDPGKYISFQKHLLRNELWFVSEGTVEVKINNCSSQKLNKHDFLNVKVGDWHQIINHTDKPVSIIEIQYGKLCTEDDIIRQVEY